MEYCYYCVVMFVGEGLEQFKDIDLIVQIESGGWFIEQNGGCLLGQCYGDLVVLMLVVGEVVYWQMGEFGGIG